MMSDKEFSKLQLRATIVPQQVRWPAPDYLHWQRLHEAANEARARLSEFYTLADEIDRNADLSRDDKHRQRRQAADDAIADFDASKTLARACEAVKLAVAKHNVEPHVRDVTRKALKEAKHGWQRAIDYAVVSPSPRVRGVLAVAKTLRLRCGGLLYPQ